MSGAQFQPGDVVGGRYRVVDHVALSATAETYLAFDLSLSREVDLHVLPAARASDPAFLTRFRAEAQRVAGLNHPHLLRVFDSGEEVGGAYLVTEHPAGGSLRQRLQRDGLLSEGQAAQTGAEIADALAYAHARGMVHGSVSPDTIFFDHEGRARLADLGLAAAVSGSRAGSTTDIRYASPEQATGANADASTDVYALALTLFESITGRPPFVGESAMATLRARVGAALPANPAIRLLDMVLALAAAPESSARPSAEQLAQRLRAVVASAPLAPVNAPAPPESKNRTGFSAPSADHVLRASTTDPVRTLPEGIEQQRGTPTAGTPVVARAAVTAFDDADSVVPPTPPRSSRRRRALTSLSVLVVLLASLGAGAAWKLGYFTRTSTVPQLLGLTQQQALTLLSPDGFTLRVSGSVTSQTAAAGAIVTQTPAAGTSLRQGATVSVQVSSGASLVSVPSNILGMDCASASSALASMGLGASCPASLAATSTTFAKGHVMALLYKGQSNPTQVPLGAAVQLVLSLGPTATTTTTKPGVTTTTKPGATTTTKPGVTTTTKPTTTTTVNPHAPRAVPSLVGLSRTQVFAAMKKAEFYFTTTGVGSANGTWHVVIAQSPAAGTMLPWHGYVRLRVK